MGVAAREIAERHLERAADGGLEVMDRAGEAVRGEPFGQGIGLEEGAIDLLRAGAKDTVEANTAI